MSSYCADVLNRPVGEGKDQKRELLLDTHKELGTVSEAFSMSRPDKFKKILAELEGNAIIGHTRYATSGPTGRSHAQPFELQHSCRWKWFAFAFNGNLANYEVLRDEILSNEHVSLIRANDTQVILHLLSEQMLVTEKPDLIDVFTRITARLDGAYNLVFLNALGEMVVLRDPLGLRPLCYVDNGKLFAAASESVPLLNLGFDEDEIHSLAPGEMLLINESGVQKHRYAPEQTPKHCFFEWIYFANVASTLDRRSVYLSRTKLGDELAELEMRENLFSRDEDTIVVPVPDTGKAAADAMAYKLNLRSVEGLIRNRYIGRTFIENGDRAAKVRAKFTALRHVLRGKRVLLVEDSIVRSTTLRNLIGYIREVGQAKEIHVRVACPPILAPCFYGIDMATVKQLYAHRFLRGKQQLDSADMDEIGIDLGADSLRYLPIEALSRCIEKPAEFLCQACVTGEYPTPSGQRKYQLELITGETANEIGGCHPMRRSLPALSVSTRVEPIRAPTAQS